jgi:hypothetical protein
VSAVYSLDGRVGPEIARCWSFANLTEIEEMALKRHLKEMTQNPTSPISQQSS